MNQLDLDESLKVIGSELEDLPHILHAGTKEQAAVRVQYILGQLRELKERLGPYALALEEWTTEQRVDLLCDPHWPAHLHTSELYEARCDDEPEGRMRVMFTQDGDAWVHVADGDGQLAGVRIRTLSGGGRQIRTRQALLWLAEAIRLDALGIWNPPAARGSR